MISLAVYCMSSKEYVYSFFNFNAIFATARHFLLGNYYLVNYRYIAARRTVTCINNRRENGSKATFAIKMLQSLLPRTSSNSLYASTHRINNGCHFFFNKIHINIVRRIITTIRSSMRSSIEGIGRCSGSVFPPGMK